MSDRCKAYLILGFYVILILVDYGKLIRGLTSINLAAEKNSWTT